MGQVGSLLLGNEMLEVQDWLLRSKRAERMIRGRWESRETPWGDTKAPERSRRQDQGEEKRREKNRKEKREHANSLGLGHH